MNSSRLSIWLLCAGAVVLACGPRAKSAASSDSARTDSTAVVPDSDSSAVASSLNVTVGQDVRLTLHVTNPGDAPLEIRFPSGQTHDFAVLDQAGREVWRWSAERMFTQALQTRALGIGESATYEERWEPGAARGTFVAVAKLTSENIPVEQRVEFTLP